LINHYSKENANTTVVVFDVVILDQMRLTENDSDDTEEDNNSNNTVGAKNYGARVSGPWVFGLCCKKK